MASPRDGGGVCVRAFDVDGLTLYGRRVACVSAVTESRLPSDLGDFSRVLPGSPRVFFEAVVPRSAISDGATGAAHPDALLDRWCAFAGAARVGPGSTWYWADLPAFDIASQLQEFISALQMPVRRAPGLTGRIALSASAAPFSIVPSADAARESSAMQPVPLAPPNERLDRPGDATAAVAARTRRVPPAGSPPQGARTPPATTVATLPSSPRSPAPQPHGRPDGSSRSSPRVTPPSRGGGSGGRRSTPSSGGVASPDWWSAPPTDRDSYLGAAVRPATRALFRAAGVLLHRAMPGAGAAAAGGDRAAASREGLFGVKEGELALLGGKRDGGEADPCSTALREFDEEAGGRLSPAEWAALSAALGGVDAPQGGERAASGVSLGGVVAAAATAAAASSGAVQVCRSGEGESGSRGAVTAPLLCPTQVAWLGGRGPHPAKYVLFLVDIDALATLADASVDAAPLAALVGAATDLVDRFSVWRRSPAANAAPSEFREMGALLWVPLATVFGGARERPPAGLASATATVAESATREAADQQSAIMAPRLSTFLSITSRDPLLRAWARGAMPSTTTSPRGPSVLLADTLLAMRSQVAGLGLGSSGPRVALSMTPEQATHVLGASTSPDEIESALAVLMDAVALTAANGAASATPLSPPPA